MNANIHINAAFRHFGLDTGPFRTDDEATTRIGQADGAVVMVSDMQQGRGQSVKIKQARKLHVRITSKKRTATADNVAPENLIEAIEALVETFNIW